MFANLSLENEALKDVIAKKALRPTEKCGLAGFVHDEHGLSQQQACVVLGLCRPVCRYAPKSRDDSPIIKTLLRLAHQYPRYSFGKLLPA
jgi:putative transposase